MGKAWSCHCLPFSEIAFSAARLIRSGEEAIPVTECLKSSWFDSCVECEVKLKHTSLECVQLQHRESPEYVFYVLLTLGQFFKL